MFEHCDLISSLIKVGGCPSCHLSNDMTSLSIGINAHDQETYDHRLTNELVLIEAYWGPGLIHTTRVLMFPINTVIAWHILYYEHNEIWQINNFIMCL